jgi:hypothetical protein
MIIMKKIIFALAMLFALGSALPVSAQDHDQQKVRFYYYPSSNVYYNVTTGQYWYYDEPNVKWIEVKTLPETVTIEKTHKYTVYYNGEEIWKDNAMHQKKYKFKKDESKKGESKKDEPEKN